MSTEHMAKTVKIQITELTISTYSIPYNTIYYRTAIYTDICQIKGRPITTQNHLNTFTWNGSEWEQNTLGDEFSCTKSTPFRRKKVSYPIKSC